MPTAKKVMLLGIDAPIAPRLLGWANPPELAAEIGSETGLPLGRSPWEAWLMEWIDLPTMLEAVEMHNVFLADAATYLLGSKPWDVYYMHIHTPDIMYHTFSVELDPLTGKNAALREEVDDVGPATAGLLNSVGGR